MYIGEFYAFGTVICWVICSLLFESAGKVIGSTVVNLIKMLLALVYISLFTLLSRGEQFPVDANFDTWLWLSLSGIVGFFIGDIALFKAFVTIGSRLSLLIYTLVPPITAVSGYFIFREEMTAQGIIGMFITIIGVSIVVFKKDKSNSKNKVKIKGIIYALIGTVGQAGGLVLSKVGMLSNGGVSYDAYSSSQIRIISSLICFILFFTFTGRWRYFAQGIKSGLPMLKTSIGAIFGPFLGVSFNLLAITFAKNMGRVSTITSLLPVAIIFPQVVILKHKVEIREIVGAIVAVAGVSLLFI